MVPHPSHSFLPNQWLFCFKMKYGIEALELSIFFFKKSIVDLHYLHDDMDARWLVLVINWWMDWWQPPQLVRLQWPNPGTPSLPGQYLPNEFRQLSLKWPSPKHTINLDRHPDLLMFEDISEAFFTTFPSFWKKNSAKSWQAQIWNAIRNSCRSAIECRQTDTSQGHMVRCADFIQPGCRAPGGGE